MAEALARRYRLGPLLGAGGMGRVYAAHDTLLDRPVAVKLLAESMGEADAARLLREARTAARFQHPSAVAVYDVGEDAGQPFVVMELVEGESLADRLRREGPLAAATVVAVLDSVLSALEAAHAVGLVHRDVKPANVLLPAEGDAKLADFGIAKQVWDPDAALTATGAVLGTPAYLAPEQAAGEETTAAVDIYATGVLAYEALTGSPPFVRSTPLATALAHQRDPVPSLGHGVPAGVAAAVRRALAKDPADRFRSAAEMREALRAPEPAAPAGTGRGRWLALAAAGIVLLGGLLVLEERGGEDGPGSVQPGADTDEDGAAGEGDGAGDGGGDGADEGGDGDQLGDADGQARDRVGGPDDEGPAAPGPGADGEAISLSELEALIRADPDWAGERADDLLEDLVSVSREDDESDRREDARELIRDVAEWLADGELEPEAAGRAVEALEPVGRPAEGALAPLSATLAALAVRSPEGGEKHKDVLDKLDGLLGEAEEDKRRGEADKLLDEIEEWRGKGELAPRVADEAARALTRYLDDEATAYHHPVRRLLAASVHR